MSSTLHVATSRAISCLAYVQANQKKGDEVRPPLSPAAVVCSVHSVGGKDTLHDCGFFLKLPPSTEMKDMRYILCGEAQISNGLSYPLSSSSRNSEKGSKGLWFRGFRSALRVSPVWLTKPTLLVAAPLLPLATNQSSCTVLIHYSLLTPPMSTSMNRIDLFVPIHLVKHANMS